MERYNTSKSRVSAWSNDPASGFPAVHHVEGRKKFWRAREVEAFFTARERAKPRLHVLSEVRRDDPDKLLTKGEVARLLGHKSTSAINNYIRNHPGYFPEPDQDGLYRLGTIRCRRCRHPQRRGPGRSAGSSGRTWVSRRNAWASPVGPWHQP
ncbi:MULTISPECIES: hypothetical protein [Streptomyces]